jgi:hypothetical protein
VATVGLEDEAITLGVERDLGLATFQRDPELHRPPRSTPPHFHVERAVVSAPETTCTRSAFLAFVQRGREQRGIAGLGAGLERLGAPVLLEEARRQVARRELGMQREPGVERDVVMRALEHELIERTHHAQARLLANPRPDTTSLARSES